MSELDELRARLTALEQRMEEEARLRAQVDRDQADQGSTIRAMHHLVQAIAITQSDEMERLRRLGQSVSAGFAEVDRQFAQLRVGQEEIVAMLNRLLEKP